MTSRRARAGFGLLAGLALVVSAGTLGMAAVAAGAAPGPPNAVTSTTAPGPPKAGATTGAAPSFSVAPTPCSPRSDGACTVAPAKVAVTVPSGTTGVSVAWTTTGRPTGTGPAHATTYLAPAAGGCPSLSTATITCTWPWPTALEAPGSSVVLNGSYAVQPCSGTAAAPACPSAPGPNNLLIAAPPAPPGGAHASGSATSVTVTWAAGPEPDLAGYALTRNDTVVFTCGVHGASLPGSVPCGSSLAHTDNPGSGGAVTYGIVAKRFGVDSNPDNYLSSQPAVVSISLGVGSSSIGALPPIPVIGTPNVVLPGGPSSTSAGAGIGAGAGSASAPTTVDPGGGGLEYGQGHTAALGPVGDAQSGHSTSVSRLALIAAGLLVLALAAHLLYLRGAVARYQMAHGGHVPGRAAHRRRRPPMRVQWGQWPPLIRDGGDLSSPG